MISLLSMTMLLQTPVRDLYGHLPQFKGLNQFELGPPGLSGPETQTLSDLAVSLVDTGKVRWKKSDSVKLLGAEIREAVLAELPKASRDKPIAIEWMIAETVCELVKRSVRYDYELARGTSTEEKIRRSLSTTVCAMGQPSAECWGFAVTTRDLARAAGLTCYLANGSARIEGVAPKFGERNHSVDVFVLSGGFQVPADVTAASCRFFGTNGKSEFGGRRKVLSQHVLPRDRFAWNLFLVRFNILSDLTEKQPVSGDVQNKWLRLDIGFEAWRNVSEIDYSRRENEYILWERSGRKSR